jgi:hypothetical protein
MSALVECTCCGRNPHCDICGGFGMMRPEDRAGTHIPKVDKDLYDYRARTQFGASKASSKKNKRTPIKKQTVTSKPLKNRNKSSIKKASSQSRAINKHERILNPIVSYREDIIEKIGLLTCDKCGAKVRKDLYNNHLLKFHTSSKNKPLSKKKTTTKKISNVYSKETYIPRKRGKTIIIRPETSRPQKQTISNKAPIKQKSKKEIRLEDRWGVKVINLTKCSCCGEITKPVWNFKLSNCGEVNICSDCKPQVFKSSFEKKDALDHAVSGGMFEGNRRRH